VIDRSATSDEILITLAQVDELLELGCTLDEACRKLRIPVAIYELWRRAHSRTFLATARRLEALQQVHERMLAVVTEQQLEIQRLQRLLTTSSSGQAAR